MDNFQIYLKKQLFDYVENERKKGVPLEQIEKILINSGHHKNIIDEVFAELDKNTTMKPGTPKQDIMSMLKQGINEFMAKSDNQQMKEIKDDIGKKTDEVITQVIEDVEIIEEKNILESIAFFIYLIFLGLAIIITASSTDAGIIKVTLGLAPAIVSVFASFLFVNFVNNVPLFVMIPLAVTSIFYIIAAFSGLALTKGLDYEALSVVNFLFGFLFSIIILYVRFIKPQSMKRRVIKKPHQKIPTLKTREKVKSREEILDLKKEFKI